MTPPPCPANLYHGVDLLNRARFFDAHEVLEDIWRALPPDSPLASPRRRHLQGMVQLAVAFHHESTGNHVGASSVLERALGNLQGADLSFPELDLNRLRADLEPWRRYLHDCNAAPISREGRLPHPIAPPLPQIIRRG
jgi:predicted metal-dependent hydrolase